MSNIITDTLSSITGGMEGVITDIISGNIGEDAINTGMVAAASLLMDPGNEQKEMQGDRVEESVASNTAITSQESTSTTVFPDANDVKLIPTATMDCSGTKEAIQERWYKLGSTDWKTTDPIYKIIGKYKYPNDFINKDTTFVSFYRFFAYFHFKVKVKVTMATTNFHTGAVAVAYAAVDGWNSNAFDLVETRYRNVRQVPHTILNAMNATSGDFTIPYCNSTRLFDRNNTEPIGFLTVIPWSQLQASNGANSTIPVTIFYSLEDVKVFGMTKGKVPFSSSEFTTVREMMLQSLHKLDKKGTVPQLFKEALKMINDRYGMEYPEVNKINVGPTVSNTANCKQDALFVEDLAFGGEDRARDDSVCSVSPIDFSKLLSIPVPIADFKWSKTDDPGKVIWQTAIGPLNFPNWVTHTGSATSQWGKWESITCHESFVDHVAKFATLWRGPLDFTFEFFNAGLMKGRVKIGLLYGESTYTSENSCYFVTHDLGIEEKTTITVPFNSWRDWMQVPSIPQRFMLQSSAFTSQNKRDYYKATSIGMLGVEVVNSLVTNNTMSSSIYVKVSVSSSDLRLAWPRFNSSHYDYLSASGVEHQKWSGYSRGLLAGNNGLETWYPQEKPFAMGSFKKESESAEADFTGSFAADTTPFAQQANLNTSCPFKESYLGNHVSVQGLMTRPALMNHGNFYTYYSSSGTSVPKPVEDAGLSILMDNSGIYELAPYTSDWANWPWYDDIRPHEHQQEVCRIGSYWTGSAIITIQVYDLVGSQNSDTKGTLKVERTTGGHGLLFATFSNDPVLTLRDVMANGAKCINLEQQKTITLRIPYYQTESLKKLSDSDVRLRLFLATDQEITISIATWIHFPSDFKLYFPTLIPNRKWFGGLGATTISGKSTYYYPTAARGTSKLGANTDKRKPIKDEIEVPTKPGESGGSWKKEVETPEGNFPSVPKSKCNCTCDTSSNVDEEELRLKYELETLKLKLRNHKATPYLEEMADGEYRRNYVARRRPNKEDKLADVIKNNKLGLPKLVESGDVESNPGPIFMPTKLRTLICERSDDFTLNDLIHCYDHHDVTFKAERAVVGTENIINVTGYLKLFIDQGGERHCVSFVTVNYFGQAFRQLRKEIRRRLLVKFMSLMRDDYPDFFMSVDSDFRSEVLGGMLHSTREFLVSKLTTLSSTLSKGANLIDKATDVIADWRTRIFAFLGKMMLKVANVVCNPSKQNIGFVAGDFILDLCMLPAIGKEVMGEITNAIHTIFASLQVAAQSEDEEHAEVEFSGIQTFGAITLVVAALLRGCVGFVSSVTSLNDVSKDFVQGSKNLNAITGGIRGVAWIVQSIWNVVNGLIKQFATGMTLEERSCAWYMENRAKIMAWDKFFGIIEESYVKEKAVGDEKMKADIRKCYKFGRQIHENCLMAKETTGMFAKLRANWAKISIWHHDLLKLDGCFQGRPEPVVIYAFGTTGCGKTLLSTRLARDLSIFMGDETASYYSLPPCFKYMDNYAQQPVVVIDDIGQASDDEDWKVFCQMVSSTPFFPDMASVADKGMAFTSPVIICTSNDPNPQPATVKDWGAIKRRLTFKLNVDVDAKYQKSDKSMDMSKVIEVGGEQNMDPWKINIMANETDGEGVGYFELLNKVKKEIVFRRKSANTFGDATSTKEQIGSLREMLAEVKTYCDKCSEDEEPCNFCVEEATLDLGVGYDYFLDVFQNGDIERVDTLLKNFDPDLVKLIQEDDIKGALDMCKVNESMQEYQMIRSLVYKRELLIAYKNDMALVLCNQIREKNMYYIKFFASLVAVVAISSLAYKGISYWMAEGYQQGEAKGVKKSAVKTVKPTVKPVVEGAGEDIENVVFKNLVNYTVMSKEKPMGAAQGLFLDSRTLLVCEHTMITIGDSPITHIRIKLDDTFQDIPYRKENQIRLVKDGYPSDFRLIGLPVTYRGRKDIVKHFVTEAQIAYVEQAQVHLLSKKDGIERIVEAPRPYLFTKEGEYKGQAENYKYASCYRYGMTERGPGDSGAPITTMMKHSPGRIMGIHVAGTSTYGMAIPVTQEYIKEALLLVPRNAMDQEPIECPDEFYNDTDLTVHTIPPYTGQKVEVLATGVQPVVYLARETDYQPSPIHGKIFPILREPAALKPGDSRVNSDAKGDPIWNMPKKYSTQTGFVDPKKMERTMVHCAKVVRTAACKSHPRILSDLEAVNGIKGSSLDQIPMATSPGYPYSTRRQGKGKRPFFEEVGVFEGQIQYEMNEELKTRVREREELAKLRKRINQSYFQSGLKNELRTLKKVKTNAARTIEGCPLDYLLLFRKYIGDFADHITRNYGGPTGSSVGCDPDIDWTYFYNQFMKFGTKRTIAVDFTNWDGKIPPDYVRAASYVINEFYHVGLERDLDEIAEKNDLKKTKPWHKHPAECMKERIEQFKTECNVRDTLFDELANTISIIRDTLVATYNGIPSGHPITAILNCLIHWMKMCVAYLTAVEHKPALDSLEIFQSNVQSAYYGDDGLSTVSKKLENIFDRFSLKDASDLEGMICTMEDKDSEMTDYSDFEESSYLKRKFVPCEENGNIVLAPIELRTIGSLLNWTRESGTFEQNVEDACWFLYHHGKEAYEHYTDLITVALEDVDLPMVLPTWKEQYQKHLIKFNMLSNEWRVRPLVPNSTVLLSRMLSARVDFMKLLKRKNLEMKKWSPYLGQPLENHSCPCGNLVFGLIDGICLECHGSERIPAWYYYKDKTPEDCLVVEKHHVIDQEKRLWDFKVGNGPGGGSQHHHICPSCETTVLHLTTLNNRRICLPCYGVKVPLWYYYNKQQSELTNHQLLMLCGDVESNPGPTTSMRYLMLRILLCYQMCAFWHSSRNVLFLIALTILNFMLLSQRHSKIAKMLWMIVMWVIVVWIVALLLLIVLERYMIFYINDMIRYERSNWMYEGMQNNMRNVACPRWDYAYEHCVRYGN